MQLPNGLHLGYCTNIHRGESWAQTFDSLKRHTLAVRDRVAPGRRYGIGLRLSADAARELSEGSTLASFQSWLDSENAYVFTINGFPYGSFHGTRVKEQVYAPDWATPERLDYTCRLFEILARLQPRGEEGSVSTVPCSFKPFIKSASQEKATRDNLWRCVEFLENLSQTSGVDLHLGLEPEPCCYLETSEEAVRFFEQMREDRPSDDRLSRRLGINYDACHLAVEYENPREALARIRNAGIRLSKLHFSSALAVVPDASMRAALAPFAEGVYFHQVIARESSGKLTRYSDLDVALASNISTEVEWRIHFHIPLHVSPSGGFRSTADHLLGVMDDLAAHPGCCRHIEMETYTWEVLPADLKSRDVVDQLAAEYEWTLGSLRARGLA